MTVPEMSQAGRSYLPRNVRRGMGTTPPPRALYHPLPTPTNISGTVPAMESKAGPALGYFDIGWRIVPGPLPSATHTGKHPILPGWQNADPTRDQVEALFFYESNIHLLTGWQIDVLDIDPGEDGLLGGEERLSAYLGLSHPYEHPGPEIITGRGGRHCLFQATGLRNTTHMPTEPKTAGTKTFLDFRGKGGQIPLPPSTSVFGPYKWSNSFGPDIWVPPAPGWLIRLREAAGNTAPASDKASSDSAYAASRPDIAMVAAKLGLHGHPKGRGIFKVRCPFHDNRKEPAMEINANKDTFKCWSCDEWGDSIDLQNRRSASGATF